MVQVQSKFGEDLEETKRKLIAAEIGHSKTKISRLRELTGKKTWARTGDIPAIDLFCGCGGASLGMINAGYDILAGLDLAGDALKTYQFNLGNAVRADVRYLPFRGWPDIEIDLLIGCPPCPGFSTMNRSRHKPRYRKQRALLKWFALAVEYLKPKKIFFENIPLARKSSEFRWMVKFLRFETAPPYELWYDILDAADFGVPQRRKRLILIGRRCDEYWMVEVNEHHTRGVINF